MVLECGLGTSGFDRLYEQPMLVENQSKIVSSLLEGRVCDEEKYINENCNKKHLLSTKCMLGSVLSASHILTHLIPLIPLVEIEVQQSEAIAKSHTRILQIWALISPLGSAVGRVNPWLDKKARPSFRGQRASG